MTRRDELGPTVNVEATVFSSGTAVTKTVAVATEVPFTIMAGETELATLLVTPENLKELTTGYLFTSGFISSPSDIRSLTVDDERWVAYAELSREPDPVILRRRLYSASCGRCALYSSVVEVGMRNPCTTRLTMTHIQIAEAVDWIGNASVAFTKTGGVHAAGFFDPESGDRFAFEDVARHNAVDKAIGRALIDGRDLSRMALLRTGRTSSEILFKTRRCGSPITVARGAPTHQAVLLSRELGITLVGFARGDSFTIYSRPERVVL
jgi:FdhD protein